MASFADVQYYIYADIVGGSEKVQYYDNVIYGCSLINKCLILATMKTIRGL